jgi:hypothetical protein
MGRSLPEGITPKKTISATMDPKIWEEFQDVVKKLQPDGDKSASAHLETIIKREIARLAGKEMPNIVDVARLQRQILTLDNRFDAMQKSLEKRDGALARFEDLMSAYKLDFEHFSNAADVIRQMLKDRDVAGSSVQDFLEGEPQSDLSLLISMIEIKAEKDKINRQLLEAHKKRDLSEPT